MAEKISETTRGVYIIMPTPFDDQGALDFASTDTLVDFFLDRGVTGIPILGVLDEANKLAPEESRRLLTHVMKRVDGKKPIVVGASNPARTTSCASPTTRWTGRSRPDDRAPCRTEDGRSAYGVLGNGVDPSGSAHSSLLPGLSAEHRRIDIASRT